MRDVCLWMRRWLLLVLALAAGGCAVTRIPKPGPAPGWGEDARRPQPGSRPQPVGSVASVNSGLGFVVIQVPASLTVAPGTRLEVRRDGQPVGVLTSAPQSVRQFLIGDIVSGEPAAGDDVVVAPDAARE